MEGCCQGAGGLKTGSEVGTQRTGGRCFRMWSQRVKGPEGKEVLHVAISGVSGW